MAGVRVGRGAAFGAVTVVNATATGVGCALAVAATTEATWSPGGPSLHFVDGPDARLVEAVAAERGVTEAGATVQVRAAFPSSRGLKTSSSVAAALVRAIDAVDGRVAANGEVERTAVAACRRAGVTLTGAYDDQAATVRGGCHLTDNRRMLIERTIPVPPLQVAVWVPAASIPKTAVQAVDAGPAREAAREAADLAREGDVAAALTLNGRAFHDLYAAAGLPVDDLPARVALSRGALGAGLSGTGPAVAALFTRRVELPPVGGGTWRWTRTVPEGAPSMPSMSAAQPTETTAEART